MRAVLGSFLCLAVALGYSPDAFQDEIRALPGAPAVAWRMFSGYIDVAPGRKMFYWFVESQEKATSAPLMLWTNGGPGCSGLAGFLTEQGPFRVKPDGKTLFLNPHAWNKVANVVFIEQPVGVGFSKTTDQIQYGDQQAAEDNYQFILGFLKRYPEYRQNAFYLASESYGGHYLPTLGRQLVERGGVPSFRGIFLGNPLTYMMYRDYGQYGTAWGHQLIPAPLWRQYEKANCAQTFPASSTCKSVTNEMDQILSGFDMYALDFPTCNQASAVGQHERLWLMRGMARAKGEQPQEYQPCASSLAAKYLNLPEVQTAIHAVASHWSECSDNVSATYNATDLLQPMMPVWQELIQKGTLKILIYSGDDDAVCATMGSQQFVWDLGYQPTSGQNWKPWKVLGQTAGFRTDFDVPKEADSEASFSFATVHGAGHMVPATQPARSLALLQSFLGASSSERSLEVLSIV